MHPCAKAVPQLRGLAGAPSREHSSCDMALVCQRGPLVQASVLKLYPASRVRIAKSSCHSWIGHLFVHKRSLLVCVAVESLGLCTIGLSWLWRLC